jgi:hypothetical protein
VTTRRSFISALAVFLLAVPLASEAPQSLLQRADGVIQ